MDAAGIIGGYRGMEDTTEMIYSINYGEGLSCMPSRMPSCAISMPASVLPSALASAVPSPNFSPQLSATKASPAAPPPLPAPPYGTPHLLPHPATTPVAIKPPLQSEPSPITAPAVQPPPECGSPSPPPPTHAALISSRLPPPPPSPVVLAAGAPRPHPSPLQSSLPSAVRSVRSRVEGSSSVGSPEGSGSLAASSSAARMPPLRREHTACTAAGASVPPEPAEGSRQVPVLPPVRRHSRGACLTALSLPSAYLPSTLSDDEDGGSESSTGSSELDSTPSTPLLSGQ